MPEPYLIAVISFSSGQNMVSKQAIQAEEDNEERRASTGTQSEFQRSYGLQFPSIPRSLGLSRPPKASQPPESAKHQHGGFYIFGELWLLVFQC